MGCGRRTCPRARCRGGWAHRPCGSNQQASGLAARAARRQGTSVPLLAVVAARTGDFDVVPECAGQTLAFACHPESGALRAPDLVAGVQVLLNVPHGTLERVSFRLV